MTRHQRLVHVVQNQVVLLSLSLFKVLHLVLMSVHLGTCLPLDLQSGVGAANEAILVLDSGKDA